MTQPNPIPRCLGLFPTGHTCPYREGCLHYTEGTDQAQGRWLPRVDGMRCFDRETDLGATVGRMGA